MFQSITFNRSPASLLGNLSHGPFSEGLNLFGDSDILSSGISHEFGEYDHDDAHTSDLDEASKRHLSKVKKELNSK